MILTSQRLLPFSVHRSKRPFSPLSPANFYETFYQTHIPRATFKEHARIARLPCIMPLRNAAHVGARATRQAGAAFK